MDGPVAIILAAGQGKRMKSIKAKVLHQVCGRPMIEYVVDAARGAGARTIIIGDGYASRSGSSVLPERARYPLRHSNGAAWDRSCRKGLPPFAGQLRRTIARTRW